MGTGLSIFAWITILAMVLKFGLSVKSKLPGDIISLLVIGLLLVSGSLPTEEALSCFSDDTVWGVLLLLVMVAALVQSGVIDWIVNHLMGTPANYTRALNRLMWPVAFLSAFLNNETVVVLFMTVAKKWCRVLHTAPSKLLIPLSYAAGMGGVCTIIGTPCNLIVSYFYQEQTGKPLNLFTPLLPGLCCTVVGLIAINLMQKRLLPVRKSPEENFEDAQDYTVELLVPTENDAVGMTVEESGLDNVRGGHLLEIVRFDREIICPVPKDEFILGGDRLVYTGQIRSILDLRETRGLVNATHHVFSVDEMHRKRQFQMATVLPDSPLVGQRMADLNWEDANGVVLVAVAREGERLQGIPREMVLRSRDTLLLEGTRLNPENFPRSLMFSDEMPVPRRRGITTLTATLIMVLFLVLNTTGLLPLLSATIICVALMVVLQCCTVKQVQQSLDWKLLCTYAGSVCIGTAISYTGLADAAAQWVIHSFGGNSVLALIVICTITTFSTEFTGATGAAAVFAPVGYQIATTLGVNPVSFMVAIMISASSSFATPGSNETHEMVAGPGGYRYTDFLRMGIPMNFIILAATIVSVMIFIPL